MDNPPVNASSPAMSTRLREVFDSFADNREVRVAILTGAGRRAFMAGRDLKAAAPSPEELPASELVVRALAVREVFWSIYDSAVPVIAAVNGPAIGSGMAIAAVCDVVMAAENAVFQSPEIDVGVLGGMAYLSLLVGRHKARELYFTGRAITAAELHDAGVVARVVPADGLLAAAGELAALLATKSPIALRLAKEAMNRVEFLPLKEAYRLEQDYTARLLTFDDAVEAREAWRDKRSPQWQWR